MFSPPDASTHPSKDRPPLPGYLPKEPEKGLILPPAPAGPGSLAGKGTFRLTGVALEGNTVFSDDALTEVANPWISTRVSLADLEEIRYRLTRKYVDAGYISSGAVLKPNQDIGEGRVTYQIVEGRLGRIDVTGNQRLKPAYIQERMWPDSKTPFHIPALQERFQLLIEDPLIDAMNGRIHTGNEPGEAVLDLNVVRSRPYALRFIADNHRSPSSGAESGTLAGSVWNFTGFGDRLDGSLEAGEGGMGGGVRFTMPLNSWGTRISMGYDRNHNAVVQAPLDAVDVESETENMDMGLTHTVFRTPGRMLDAGVTLAVRESRTFLDDNPFPFNSGADDNGVSRAVVLRLFQSYVDRSPNSAFILRATASFGLDLFDATIHPDNRPDGEFVAFLGQMQYARRMGERFGQVILRGDVQLSSDNLLSLEQFSLGGMDSVRGYRENQRVRDNGYFLSAEWRCPIWEGTQGKELQTVLFTDYGSAWNKGEDAGDDPLFSAGIGLLWQIQRHVRAEIYWAHDLEPAGDTTAYDLQDDGIHFRITVNFFPDTR